jgi:raffinose/stachyose/melibiose transport system permease protein
VINPKLQARVASSIQLIARLCVTGLFLLPFYVAFCYAFKSRLEIAETGLAFPKFTVLFSNFIQSIEQTRINGMPFYTVMWNTLFTSALGTVIVTILAAMTAYVIARRKHKFYFYLYSIMVFTLLIPIQAYMFPLYKLLVQLRLMDTLQGFMLAKIGTLLGFSIIIITGFIKTIPMDIEEAALGDGAGILRTFTMIVLPLMKPILLTSVVINALNLWNDFSIAFIVLNKPAIYIVTLLQFAFMGTNSIKVNLAFALFSMTMIPILILYFILQRYIISGIIMGAVKG